MNSVDISYIIYTLNLLASLFKTSITSASLSVLLKIISIDADNSSIDSADSCNIDDIF